MNLSSLNVDALFLTTQVFIYSCHPDSGLCCLLPSVGQRVSWSFSLRQIFPQIEKKCIQRKLVLEFRAPAAKSLLANLANNWPKYQHCNNIMLNIGQKTMEKQLSFLLIRQ